MRHVIVRHKVSDGTGNEADRERKRNSGLYHFLKSKTKEPPKLLSSSGMKGGNSISVNNVSAQ